MKDWEWIAEMWCYGFWGFGVRPEDIVYFAFGYGSFIGFWGAHYACEKIGALVIPGGAQTTEARVKQIVEMGVTTVCSTPTYALRLWQQAHGDGHRPGQRQQGQQGDPLRRAGRLDPRRQAPTRGGLGREVRRHRRA